MPSKNVQEAFIFHWKFIIFYTKIIVFSNKNQCFHTSPYIDDDEKICKKTLYFCSKLIFFDSKSSFLLFPVYRWSKKCWKIVHFHRKFIEKFVIFQRKNHIFTNPRVRTVSTKIIDFLFPNSNFTTKSTFSSFSVYRWLHIYSKWNEKWSLFIKN